MSTRAQRRERAAARAQGRRSHDPVADRAAAAAAIYAEYSTTAVEAFERLMAAQRAAWEQWGREHAEAWAVRCRKLGELEDREPARTPEEAAAALEAARQEELERELEDDAGTSRLIADLRGHAGEESIGAAQERADIEESGQ